MDTNFGSVTQWSKEIGYLPMNREQTNLVSQVIAACYEKDSLIVTRNLQLEHSHEWKQALDCLINMIEEYIT